MCEVLKEEAKKPVYNYFVNKVQLGRHISLTDA